MADQNQKDRNKYPLGQPIDYADPRNLTDDSSVDTASINGLGDVEGADQPGNPDSIEALRTPVQPDKNRKVIPIPGISAVKEKK